MNRVKNSGYNPEFFRPIEGKIIKIFPELGRPSSWRLDSAKTFEPLPREPVRTSRCFSPVRAAFQRSHIPQNEKNIDNPPDMSYDVVINAVSAYIS